MQYETALLVGGSHDGREVETYPGQYSIKMFPVVAEYVPVWDSPSGDQIIPLEIYRLHRVHDSSGFHRIIGLLEGDRRGPMQALYEGYKKENANA